MNVTGLFMDSVANPMISLTVVVTRQMNDSVDSSTTNYEVSSVSWKFCLRIVLTSVDTMFSCLTETCMFVE